MNGKINLIVLISFVISLQSFAKDEWEFITEKKGFKVFAKDSKENPIQSLRAEGIVRADIEKVVGILRDVDSATKWLPNLDRREYIQNISDTEAILYDVSKMPWPVKNRDMVVHHRLFLAEDKSHLLLQFNSIQDKKIKKNDSNVRAVIYKGEIQFYPKKDETFVKLTLLVDPKGAIPKWVVNMLQVKFPFDFLNALDQFAVKTDKEPLPGIAKLIAQIPRS